MQEEFKYKPCSNPYLVIFKDRYITTSRGSKMYKIDSFV
jgi:hypothetical protein